MRDRANVWLTDAADAVLNLMDLPRIHAPLLAAELLDYLRRPVKVIPSGDKDTP